MPRFVYDREVQRADRGDAILDKIAASVKDLTDEVRRRQGGA